MYARLPQAFATLPDAAARDPPGAARNPGRRLERLLPPRRARWVAAGDLLHQPQGHRRLAEIFASRPHLSRRRARPSSADQHRPGIEATSRCIRKVGGFSAYSEGWALYSEQLSRRARRLSAESSTAGYLQSFLFRAARLVIDTGLHAKRWSREQATDYMVATTGFARPRSQREIERYCTQVGQACSYKVGHIAWLRARDEAQRALGPRFDVKRVPRSAARRRDAAVDPRAADPRADRGAGGRRSGAERAGVSADGRPFAVVTANSVVIIETWSLSRLFRAPRTSIGAAQRASGADHPNRQLKPGAAMLAAWE